MQAESRKGKVAGFSLVEILVSLAIASIGFLGLAALQTSTLRGITIGRRAAIATSIASDRLEIARRGRFADVDELAPEGIVADGYSFTVSQSVGALAGGNAKDVTVTVTWVDQFGSHSISTASAVSR